MLNVDVLVFDGFDELDAIGPYEVLRTAGTLGAELRADLVGLHGPGAITASHGTRLVVDRGPAADCDVVIVPGGGWGGRPPRGTWAEVKRGNLTRLLRETNARGAVVASVCTGGMAVAAAGLVEARPATTHWSALGEMRDHGAVSVDARVVDDGDLLTSAGVTAGLDLAMWLVQREFGAGLAEKVAREMEHERQGRVHVAAEASR